MKTLPAVGVVIVGGGWTGLLMAKELGQRTSVSVVVLERGGPRKTDEYANDMDELEYGIRFHMMQDLSLETVTLRHSSGGRALPLRQHSSFRSFLTASSCFRALLKNTAPTDCPKITRFETGALRMTNWNLTMRERNNCLAFPAKRAILRAS